jgi:hypothetical protein
MFSALLAPTIMQYFPARIKKDASPGPFYTITMTEPRTITLNPFGLDGISGVKIVSEPDTSDDLDTLFEALIRIRDKPRTCEEMITYKANCVEVVLYANGLPRLTEEERDDIRKQHMEECDGRHLNPINHQTR